MATLLDVPIPHIISALIVLAFLHGAAKAIYNVTFHPLAKFPGPTSRSAFAFPAIWGSLRGRYVRDVNAIHQKYGPVVRISPDSISFATAQAWKDIYALQEGKVQLQKDYKRFPDRPEPIHLFGSPDVDHARMRKILNHAFSSSALREQERIVDNHIDTLLGKLKKRIGIKLDINHWFVLMTFDILSHLTFGESFNSVSAEKSHSYVEDFFQKMSIYPIIYASREYAFINWLMKMMMRIPAVAAAEVEYFRSTEEKVNKRLSKEFPDQHDFMKYIISNNVDKGMDHKEMVGVTTVLVNAGGQELAVILSSTIYYLLRNKHTFQRAQMEAISQQSKTYMMAVLNEALRLHPPVSGNFQRRTSKAGNVIDGHFIPSDISVGVNQFAAFRLPTNFVQPETFAPQRWLPEGTQQFRDDKKEAFQPFSIGPRACLGKALALMVASRTITKFLETFDMELCEDSRDWDEEQTYNVSWGRPPLYVVLRARV